MTTQDKASAEWDAMTHEQKIEWLATNVMGWKVIGGRHPTQWIDGATYRANWNPFIDWNDTMDVLSSLKMRKIGWTLICINKNNNHVLCNLDRNGRYEGIVCEESDGKEAICKAAFLFLHD